MSQNLIKNGEFNQSSQNWLTYGWYSGNTIEFLPTGGLSGGCAKLTVPSTGDPGQSIISQMIPLIGGHTYKLEFYAKRVSNVDVWVSIFANGQNTFSPSFANNIPPNGGYKKLSYTFTVTGQSEQVRLVKLSLIAGSSGGTAWFDSVSLSDNSGSTNQFDPTKYVETLANARIFKTPDSTNNDNYGSFHAGALFVFDGIENNMVRILFGNANGTTQYAYIKKNSCKSSSIPIEEIPNLRMATIAKSLVGAYGVNLGLGGDYCESFVHWLAGASGLPHEVYTGSNYCGPAVQYYNSIGAYDVRAEQSPLYMFEGDVVYYNVTNFGTGNIQAAHAGFIVEDSYANSNQYLAVEGNVGEKNRNNQGKIAFVRGNKTTGLNDTHNRTLHGVAHPFGIG